MRPKKAVSEEAGWEVLSSEVKFADNHLEVVNEIVRTPTRGASHPWTIVRRKPAVIIAPVREDGKFLLVRQERIPLHAAIWEMPAGQIDEMRKPNKNEIERTALRELGEETGYKLAEGAKLVALGHYFSSPGFTDERGYFFLACPVVRDDEAGEWKKEESILECRAFAAMELRRMIAENEICDANTLSICARLAARGLLALEPCT